METQNRKFQKYLSIWQRQVSVLFGQSQLTMQAAWLEMAVFVLVDPCLWSRIKYLSWMDIYAVCTDMAINSADFGNIQNFSVVPPAGQIS